MQDQEVEIKFYVKDLAGVESRLKEMGAQLVNPRTHEINLHFDTAGSDLAKNSQVLRLRQDKAARLTYKGPTEIKDGVRIRKEIEFTVGDFRAAREFLHALGYLVSMIYEKFRTVYEYEGVSIVLDELPYGMFVEIEGPDSGSIRLVNQHLKLNWDAGVPASYVALFHRLRAKAKLEFRDLVFENFEGIQVTAADLDVIPADP